MGRHSGYIALYTAICAGAEIACLPEVSLPVEKLIEQLRTLKARGKHSIITVVAEGVEGGADSLHAKLKTAGCPFSTRAVILGHLQRGGAPVPADRLLASRLGEFAVQAILAGHTGVMAGELGLELSLTPFEKTYSAHKNVPTHLLSLLNTLAN